MVKKVKKEKKHIPDCKCGECKYSRQSEPFHIHELFFYNVRELKRKFKQLDEDIAKAQEDEEEEDSEDG